MCAHITGSWTNILDGNSPVDDVCACDVCIRTIFLIVGARCNEEQYSGSDGDTRESGATGAHLA